jgi:hypothetical protein
MMCEYSNAAHRLVEVSPEAKLTWEHKFPSIAVCFRMTAEDHFVFADGGNPTGIQVIDRNHNVTFDYRAKCEQVLSCDVLSPCGTGSVSSGRNQCLRRLDIDREIKHDREGCSSPAALPAPITEWTFACVSRSRSGCARV